MDEEGDLVFEQDRNAGVGEPPRGVGNPPSGVGGPVILDTDPSVLTGPDTSAGTDWML